MKKSSGVDLSRAHDSLLSPMMHWTGPGELKYKGDSLLINAHII